MKKLLLAFLAFVLSFSTAFGNESLSEQDALKIALEKEKKFLLAVTTGVEGEHEIGRRPYSKSINSDFYIDISRCETEDCRIRRDEALRVAQQFASDFNTLLGGGFIRVLEEGSNSAIPIYLVESRINGNRGYWFCQRGTRDSGRRSGCNISILAPGNTHFHSLVAHEMLNMMGIQDTLQPEFAACISYDGRGKNTYYRGLCDIEKRAVLFAQKYLRPGMRRGQIESIFNEKWQFSETTSALAEKFAKAENARKDFCQRFSHAPSCKLDDQKETQEKKNTFSQMGGNR